MTDQADGTKLAQQLENVSELALDWLKGVLSMPIDTECGPLLRAQSSAAMTTLNTQIRADALRLRAQRVDKTIEKLLDTIREQEARVPSDERCLPSTDLLARAPTL